jgi:hypothetical protein
MAVSAIKVNDAQWKVGVASLVPSCTVAAGGELRRVCEEGLRLSQEAVHVDTGRTKASGRIEGGESAGEVSFDVVYGGEQFGVDYAGWLEVFNPYLAPAMEQALAGYGVGPDLFVGPFG